MAFRCEGSALGETVGYATNRGGAWIAAHASPAVTGLTGLSFSLDRSDHLHVAWISENSELFYSSRPVAGVSWAPPAQIATLGYNFALGFSCFHTLAINLTLLPRELRPGWFVRVGLVLSGIFFLLLGCAAACKELGWV